MQAFFPIPCTAHGKNKVALQSEKEMKNFKYELTVYEDLFYPFFP